MDEDLDFGTANASFKRNVRQGRRAIQEPKKQEAQDSSSEGGEVNEEDVDVVSEDEMHKSDPEEAPPKPSKGGWGEESSGNATTKLVPRRRRGENDDIKDLDAFDEKRMGEESDSDQAPDIPVIPELEDAHEDELTQQVVVVPRVQVNRVATYRDLEHDLGQYASLTTLDNEIDLKVLTKCLVPEADIIEEDVGWTWDTLFTEVSSELLTEWEAAEQAEQEAIDTAS